jgi:serine/threonine-protein kinase
MAGGDDETVSAATVADRPAMRASAPDCETTDEQLDTGIGPSAIAAGGPPGHSSMAIPAGLAAGRAERIEPDDPTINVPGPPAALLAHESAAARGAEHELSAPTALTTAADAMRNEEIDRTRTFIRMGWLISLVAMAGVPVLHAPRAMSIALVVGLATGILVSIPFYRAFADPARYNERALMILAVMCLVNAHIAVLYFGTFTVASLIVVIGIHFVARTEAARAARWILATAIALYSCSAIAIITGAIDDPGVFASDRPMSLGVQLVGAGFVLGTYTLAYVTARAFRQASLRSIESLQRATRLASQREALMDELRLDLERALRAGGPGRYTDHMVGNFKLGSVLGRGAMGEVYDAVDASTGEPAAVKLVRRDLSGDRTHLARFVREARASSALDSPYVVRVLDASDRDPPYLAMERLHGHTLAEQLRKDGRLTAIALGELLRHIGAGLDAARAAGIVHRDIKPQNLFHSGVWKILDFGVATLSEENSGTLTQGGIIGTPSYMAPEQAQSKRLDGRADLYALAAVAYRCITGRHPFSGADTPGLLYAVVHRMPPRPGEIVDLPPDLDRWFALALAKLPDDRFATGQDLADAYEAALASALDPRARRQADGLLRKLAWS